MKILHYNQRERETVLNRKHNYLKISNQTFIENFLCKALWKVAFYSILLRMYMHISKNAQKKSTLSFVNRGRIWEIVCDFSPQIRAQYTTFKKEWLLQTFWIGSENTGFLFSYQRGDKSGLPKQQTGSYVSFSEPSGKLVVLVMSCSK